MRIKKTIIFSIFSAACLINQVAFAQDMTAMNQGSTVNIKPIKQFFHFMNEDAHEEGVGVLYEGQTMSQAKDITDIAGREITPGNVNLLKNIPDSAIQNSPSLPSHIVMLPPLKPLTGASQFFAIGFNYKDHAAEFNIKPGAEPTVFFKSIYSITGPYSALNALTRDDEWLDYEAELGVVIGKNIYGPIKSEAEANDAIAGYIVVIDLSDRNAQMNKGGQLTKGKSGLDYGPIGPFFVPNDGRIDPTNLEISTWLNGKLVQHANTGNMIFNVYSIMQHLSPYFPMRQGDIITTGTPLGQIYGKPGINSQDQSSYMKKGDKLEVEIQHLGTQSHVIN